MTLLLEAGNVVDFGGKRGTATLAFDMLDEGAGRMDALEISAKLEGLGAQLGAGAGADLGSVTLSAVTANLEPSLDVFADVVLRPTFPEKELARLKPQYAAALQQQKAQAAGLARLIAPGLIYGPTHPYATNGGLGLNSQAELDAIALGDVKAFHQRWFRPDNATLLVVGAVTLEQMKPLLEARFGGWKAPAEAIAKPALPAAPAQGAPRIFLISKPGAAQSVLWAGEIAPPITDPQNIAMRTLNNALGGIFASRLNLNLREDKHWSYGARSGIGDNRGQRLFAASAPVETAYTVDALREMQKEFRDILGKRPLAADEIKLAKDAEVLSLPANNETAPQIAGSYAHILTYGLPDTYFNDLVDQVNGLTQADLAAAAKKLVRPEALTWVVVGDLAKIEAPIRNANLGEVKVLDENGAIVR
jgi:zinc protease